VPKLRLYIEGLGHDKRVTVRERYVEFDRRGEELVIVEPTAHHRFETGFHNPGLPFDERFREAVGFVPRRITGPRIVAARQRPRRRPAHTAGRAYALAFEGESR
jgi:hypothetical protein